MKLIALLALILGLIGAHSQEVKNVFEFKRALDTCDRDGDFVIKKSGPTKVVFAMGSSDPEGNTLSASEFSNPDIIGTKDIDFFAKSKKAAALAPAAIKSRAKEEKPLKDAKSLVVMASDIHVPANLTTYYFCAIRNFEMNDLKENLQIIRAQAFLGGNKAAMEEEESGVNEKAIVTNFALYACPPDFDVAEENETISSSDEQQQQFNLSEPIIPDANFTMTSDGAQGDCIGMPRRYLKCVRSPVALWSIRGGSPDLPENVGIPLNTSGTFVLKIRIDNLAESAQMLANNLKEEMPVKESAEKEESNETSSTSGHVQAHVISKLNDTKQGYGFRIWYTDKPREQESSFFEMAAVKLLHFPMGNLTSQSSNATESESSETSKESEKEKPSESGSESEENVGEQSILSAVCPAQCVQGLPEEGVTVFQLNLLGLSKMRVRLIRDGKEISLLADQERLNLDSMADIKTKTVLKEPVKIKNGDILITTCVFEEDELDTPEIDSLDICMATLQYYPRVPSFLFCASMPFHNVTTLKSSNLTMVKNASEESESESNKTASAEESSHEDLPSWLFPQIAFCAKVNETIPKDALLQPKLLLKHIQPVMIKTPPVFTAKEKSNETESESSETKEKENQGFFDDEQMAEGDQESEWQGDQDQEEQEMGLDLEDEYAGLNELDLEGLEFEDDEEGTKLTMGKCIRPAMPHSTVLSSGKKAIGQGENDTGHMHLHAFTNSEKLDDEGKMRLLWRCEASKKTCQFAVEAETKGWVAIGFKEKGEKSEENKDALKKADFAVAWITDDKDLHFIDMNTLKSDSPKVDDSQDFYDIRGIESSDIEKFTTHAAAAPGKNTTAIKENIKNATQPVPPAQTATGQTGPVPSQTGTTGRHQKGSASRSTEASFSVLLSFAVGWLAVVLAM